MRLISSSDHHTSHRRTPTAHVLRNLSTFLYTDVDLSTIDVLFFTGDVFDRRVEKEDEEFKYTLNYFKDLFQRYKKANPKGKVRFVEGTTLHDWDQIQHIMLTVEEDMDVKHFDKISIETFDDLDGLTVMYVPDNMASKTPDEIWELALNTLSAAGLSQVDLIALHGGFYYQLPEKGRRHAHMETRWESIVKYGIFSGHIHVPSHNGNKIYSNGSFDRCRHGEEHDKGAWIIDLDLKKEYFKPTFWVNKNALPYITIKVQIGDLPEHVINKVKALLQSKKFPKASQFRLQGGHRSVVNPIVNALEKEYPDFGFSEDSENDEAIVDDELFTMDEYEGVSVTKENIFELVMPVIEPDIKGTDITADEIHELIKEFL